MKDPREQTLLKKWIHNGNKNRYEFEIHAGRFNKYMRLDVDKRLYEYLILPSIILRREIYDQYTTLTYLSLSWINIGVALRIRKSLPRS